jgi:K(+)-stimulated pyrophosphate-energized sodium pump
MVPQVAGSPHSSRSLFGWRFLPAKVFSKGPFLLALAALFSLLTAVPAQAAEGDITLPAFDTQAWVVLAIALFSSIVGVAYAIVTRINVKRESPGSQAMQDVAIAIEDGAMAYLSRQIKLMAVFVAVLFVVLLGTYMSIPGMPLDLALGTAVAFILGVGASYLAGFIGMKMAVEGNVRTANAALSSFKRALEIAFRSGSVAGMATVGLGLFGATIIFLIFRENAMRVLVGFGFGGSLAALFMRVGGGIFTKAADVGADLVGKVEQNIPEDDPRNPATIADNVGDNVGDCAGMAADVFESYEVTLVAAIILGVAVNAVRVSAGLPPLPDVFILKLAMFPLLVRSVGVFASIVGIWSVKGRDDPDMNPMEPISRGFWISAAVASVAFILVAAYYLPTPGVTGIAGEWWRYAGATFMGILLALVIEKVTEFYTATEKAPVQEIAASSRTGPATMILSGFSEGLESAWWGVIAIAATLLGSMALFPGDPGLAMYGVSLAGLGLLTTTGFILAEDTFGPISDNANGIFEMSGALHHAGPQGVAASRIVAKLDAVGNTTKALTKGFAIATAVIAAVALFSSFIEDANLHELGIRLDYVEVFIGLLIGGAVPFLFSSFAIRAVSRAAVTLVEEVRRQFREIPGIMEGTARPEYGRCVDICTAAAQRELMGPAILAVATPILVAFGLGFISPQQGAMALGGYFAGAILSGQLMAVLLSNSGGAWDNAKKLIEEGLYGGKGSEAHKAGVICDTVGDPFKDTAGPALNPLIKVMNLVGLLIAPMAIRTDFPVAGRVIIVVIAAGSLGWAIMFSRRKAPASTPPTQPLDRESPRTPIGLSR